MLITLRPRLDSTPVATREGMGAAAGARERTRALPAAGRAGTARCRCTARDSIVVWRLGAAVAFMGGPREVKGRTALTRKGRGPPEAGAVLGASNVTCSDAEITRCAWGGPIFL